MKKQINHHPEHPNFILQNQGILHTFQGSIRDFYTRTHTYSAKQTPWENQDFLIIDNDTGEIIKA